MEQQLFWIIAAFGFASLAAVVWKMKEGFGPFNLKVFGIVIVATFASLLAIAKSESLSAALGILGAIAGYLFGAPSKQEDSKGAVSSSVDIEDAEFGDNAKVAGRDIVENIANMRNEIAQIKNSVIKQYPTIEKALENLGAHSGRTFDYLVNTIYERQAPQVAEAIQKVTAKWQSDGWELMSLTSDYHGMDGLMLVFRRLSQHARTSVTYYHGSTMEPLG